MVKGNPKISIAHSKVPFILGLTGGILTVLIALIVLIEDLWFGLWGLLSGIAIITGAILLRVEGKFKQGSLTLIIASIVAMVPTMFIGAIISLVGGILTYVKKRI